MISRICALGFAGLAFAFAATPQQHPIDIRKSVLTVHVSKSGIFSAAGHNHEIAAPIAGGDVDAVGHQVELKVNSNALQVRDPEVSEKDRARIQSTMLGPEVLDTQRYPEIVFRSTGANSAGQGVWKVQGNLTFHGQTRPVEVEVHEAGGHYDGSASFKQTEFGIKPVKVAGGTIRVKDEVRIEFQIYLAP
jgi:polyisoprenoid-binding protein YceI